jgi:uncharacterized protein (TIGR02594 family)
MSYEYLKNIVSPKHIVEAVKLIGVKETAGAKNNPLIMGWTKELSLEKIYVNDEMSWCALFAAYVLFKANRRVILKGKDPYDYLRAVKYADYGVEVSLKNAAFGDILIFKRPGGFHIGFYVGEDQKNYHVLGGNQSNMVNVAKIAATRLISVRRPAYNSYEPEKMIVNAAGPVSFNEA